MTILVRPEILSSLNSVREDVQRQVASLDRFRALKAIEQTIADFPALDDLTRSLSEIRERVQEQLDQTREYRALQTIERIVPELTEVFALLEERETPEEPASSPAAEDGPACETVVGGDGAAGSSADAATGVVGTAEFESAIFVEIAEPDPVAEQDGRARSDTADAGIEPVAAGFEPPNEWSLPKPERHPDPVPDRGSVPSLADSVAQLMAQSAPPPPREMHAPPQPSQERGDAVPTPAERAA